MMGSNQEDMYTSKNEDTEFLRKRVPELKHLAPRNQLGGWSRSNLVSRKDKSSSFTVFGDYPEYNKIEIREIHTGRFINDMDIDEERKVAVVGESVTDLLFTEDEDPMGQYIKINDVNFKIVGLFKSTRSAEEAERDNQTIYVPFTTFQKAFKYGNRVGWYAYSVDEGVPVSVAEEKIISLLKEKHHVHPDDEDAIGHANLEEEFEEVSGLFKGIGFFTWFVGLSALFAGIIGISNIMLIIVKERTKEIGIRKSMGATPFTIISLIIQESVFLTTIGGYVALIVGIYLLEALAQVIPADDGPLGRTEVDIPVVLGALGILICGGVFAGILPARKAAAIRPIEALRVE